MPNQARARFPAPEERVTTDTTQGPIEVIDSASALAAAPGDLSPMQIVHEVEVDVPASTVWALWTTTEGIQSWLVGSANIELRIGGPFELHFMADAPEGSKGSEGCKILSYLPEAMLSFTWNSPPDHPEIRRQRTWVVVELTPTDRGTGVTLTHLGWPESGWSEAEETHWPETFEHFDKAWSNVLEALRTHLAE
jgi:uncharacterized protein YndB with AHSA1/START domain